MISKVHKLDKLQITKSLLGAMSCKPPFVIHRHVYNKSNEDSYDNMVLPKDKEYWMNGVMNLAKSFFIADFLPAAQHSKLQFNVTGRLMRQYGNLVSGFAHNPIFNPTSYLCRNNGDHIYHFPLTDTLFAYGFRTNEAMLDGMPAVGIYYCDKSLGALNEEISPEANTIPPIGQADTEEQQPQNIVATNLKATPTNESGPSKMPPIEPTTSVTTITDTLNTSNDMTIIEPDANGKTCNDIAAENSTIQSHNALPGVVAWLKYVIEQIRIFLHKI